MNKQKTLLLCVIPTLALSQSYAAECTHIDVVQNSVYNLSAQINQNIHITTSERLAAPPLVGNSQVWRADGAPNSRHAFIKPTSQLDEGKRTTLSLITEYDNSVNFVVTRVDAGADVCVVVNFDTPSIMNSSAFSGLTSTMNVEERTIQALQNALQASGEQVKAVSQQVEQEKAASIIKQQEALASYSQSIRSNYTWRTKGKPFWSKSNISSVFDDGRFTYIRIIDDTFGVPTVQALRSGKPILIDPTYDPRIKTYTITGIFNKLQLVYDKNYSEIISQHKQNKAYNSDTNIGANR